MYISERLFSNRYFSKKLIFPHLLIGSILLLSGCSGDDLNKVTTNPDGSIVISTEVADTAKNAGIESLPTLYMIKLKWNPPTTKVGGTPLNTTEIKQYRISYFQLGNEAASTSLTVGNNTQSLGIPVSAKGTYQFKIITIDTSGRESEPQLVTASL
jgi:hypothetical protein